MAAIDRLLQIMARLRDPQRGCPWDLEQTFATIAPYTIEEAYEVADAIEREDSAALRDELGDLLFQVVFHSRMAQEQGSFAFDDVATAISDKLERRHPHVFGNAQIETAVAQTVAWEEQKRLERERAGKSILADVPLALPALTRANKLGKRAAQVGFEWPNVNGALDKLDEELGELMKKALAVSGIPVRSKVLEVSSRRLPQAYPLYTLGYREHFERIDQWLNGLAGILTFGRQGLFAHDNTHHALAMAYAASDCLDDAGTLDSARWQQHRLAFQHHVVED